MELKAINKSAEMRPLSLGLRIHPVGKPEFQLDGAKQDVVLERFVKRWKQNLARLVENDFGGEHQLERWSAASAFDFADGVSADAEKFAEFLLRQAAAQALGTEVARKARAGHFSAPAAYAGALVRISNVTVLA